MWKIVSEPILVPVPFLFLFVIVEKPGTGINHGSFPEAISGTKGSVILISLGTLDRVGDVFDAVVSSTTYPLESAALLVGISAPHLLASTFAE